MRAHCCPFEVHGLVHACRHRSQASASHEAVPALRRWQCGMCRQTGGPGSSLGRAGMPSGMVQTEACGRTGREKRRRSRAGLCDGVPMTTGRVLLQQGPTGPHTRLPGTACIMQYRRCSSRSWGPWLHRRQGPGVSSRLDEPLPTLEVTGKWLFVLFSVAICPVLSSPAGRWQSHHCAEYRGTTRSGPYNLCAIVIEELRNQNWSKLAQADVVCASAFRVSCPET